MYKLLDIKKTGRSSRYFHPSRTQPFIVTFFQAVLALRKVLKLLRLRRATSRQTLTTRKNSSLENVVRKSNRIMIAIKRGQAAWVAELEEEVKQLEDCTLNKDGLSESDRNNRLANTRLAKMEAEILEKIHARDSENAKIDEINHKVSDVLSSYYNRIRNQARLGTTLGDRLDAEVRARDMSLGVSEKSKKVLRNRSAGGFKQAQHSSTPLGLFQMTSDALGTYFDDGDDGQHQIAPIGTQQLPETIEVGEYLDSTPIYYGATMCLQAKHGGYLSYNNNEVKASAHKILANTRFIVRKSGDLTDIGVVKYGDPLWLQTNSSFVLGATYGSIIDKKRIIQPALISCKRATMFKAQQYGRWIILNRDDPMGTLGKHVGHKEKIILEQEWYFLASNSPYSSHMFKIISNSDEAMTTKVDLFYPTDECVWTVHLVALPSDGGDEERQRQKLLQTAKEQIDVSESVRYKKSGALLSTLVSTLPDELQEEHLLKTVLKHKVSDKAEQEHLSRRFRAVEKRDFSHKSGSPEFLSLVYGPSSPIVKMRQESFKLAKTERISIAAFQNSLAKQYTSAEPVTKLATLENKYWDAAQKVLVNSKSWGQISHLMAVYSSKKEKLRIDAALIIQRCVRRFLERKFDYERAFRRVDKNIRQKIEQKQILRERLIMEQAAAVELAQSNALAAANSAGPNRLQIGKGHPKRATPSSHNKLNASTSTTLLQSQSLSMRSQSAHGKRSSVSINADHFNTRATNTVDEDEVLALTLQSIQPENIAAVESMVTKVTRKTSLHDIIGIVGNQSPAEFALHSSPAQGRRISSSQRARSASKINTRQTSDSFFENRPQTAPSQQQHQESRRIEELRATLMKKPGNNFGLPADVFEGIAPESSMKVGVKFLKAMSSTPGIYDDIDVKRRDREKRYKKRTQQELKKWVTTEM